MTPSFSTTEKISLLNDAFRSAGPLFGRARFDGLWLITAGVQGEGPEFTWSALVKVQSFDAFTADNDPHGEHDFGSFDLDGRRVFWKIDYLARGTQHGAEDPSDNVATSRVITIMLAEEW